jgi:hypothetical protein
MSASVGGNSLKLKLRSEVQQFRLIYLAVISIENKIMVRLKTEK